MLSIGKQFCSFRLFFSSLDAWLSLKRPYLFLHPSSVRFLLQSTSNRSYSEGNDGLAEGMIDVDKDIFNGDEGPLARTSAEFN